jgi:hypothetical protein
MQTLSCILNEDDFGVCSEAPIVLFRQLKEGKIELLVPVILLAIPTQLYLETKYKSM